jgi:hypothetical protein
MRSAVVSIAAFLILGIAALQYGYTRGQDSEWRPITLPYPGPNYSIEDEFHIYRSGRFQIEVFTPVTKQERRDLREGPPVATNLHVLLTGRHGFRAETVIHSVTVGSWGTGMAYSPSPHIEWRLPSGDYTLRVTGAGAVPNFFSERGSQLRLARLEPVGPDIGIELAKWLGYVLLALALGITIQVALLSGKSGAAKALSNST